MLDTNLIATERDPTRERHLIIGDLEKMVCPEFHPNIWELINELENTAWESGAEEGYQNGHQNGWDSAEVIYA